MFAKIPVHLWPHMCFRIVPYASLALHFIVSLLIGAHWILGFDFL
jgi:hypothetical protein